jgi:hypothetical protein
MGRARAPLLKREERNAGEARLAASIDPQKSLKDEKG